jgi:hypothetical protein
LGTFHLLLLWGVTWFTDSQRAYPFLVPIGVLRGGG